MCNDIDSGFCKKLRSGQHWYFTFTSTPQLLSLSKTAVFDQDRVPKFRISKTSIFKETRCIQNIAINLCGYTHIYHDAHATRTDKHTRHTHTAHTHTTHARIHTHKYAHTHIRIHKFITIYSSKSSSFLTPFLSVICASFWKSAITEGWSLPSPAPLTIQTLLPGLYRLCSFPQAPPVHPRPCMPHLILAGAISPPAPLPTHLPRCPQPVVFDAAPACQLYKLCHPLLHPW